MKRIIVLLAMTFTMLAHAQNTPPVLTNFRIESNQPSRIYFDSSSDISGLTASGFIISNKTITSISVNGSSKTGHYFTVNSNFTFWDNYTIRFDGNESIIKNFPLQFIVNKIPEPNGNGKVYYVSASGNDGHDGLSESNSWRTISHAASVSKAGDVVYIKAGEYKDENVVFNNNGNINNPISFIGYRNTPGELSTINLEYNNRKSIGPNEMPVLIGKNRGIGIGLKLYNKSYIFIKNIKIEGYRIGIDALSGAHHLYFKNLFIHDLGGTSSFPGEPGMGFRLDDVDSHHNTIESCLVMNATMTAIKLGGNHNSVLNTRTYADQDDINNDGRSMDYHVAISGSYNMVQGHYAEHVGDLRHTGHGIALKGSGNPTEYNLLENCDVVNINGSIEFRHRSVKHNIARNIRIRGVDSSRPGGFVFRDGASFNIVENSYAKDLNKGNKGFGVMFLDTSEDEGLQWSGSDNVVRNSWFSNCSVGIAMGGSNSIYPGDIKDNEIINCNFHSINILFDYTNLYKVISNKFINNSVTRSNKIQDEKAFTSNEIQTENNNFFDNLFGKNFPVNNYSFNPQYQDAESNNFRLKPDSPLIDKGKSIEGLKYDFEGKARPSGTGIDIGAFEYQDKTTSAIKADAGKDQTICSGGTATLTASGGSSYKWSTGATTKSISVSPKSTTTYSVTVSEGTSSGTDEVLVTVNALPMANAGADVSVEAGQSTTLTASGGDTYIWSTGETTSSITVKPASSMIYEVKVNKNGCESSDSVKVTVNNSSTGSGIVADAGKDVSICLGSNAVLIASGGLVYTWSNGSSGNTIVVSPDKTTTYTVTVSDGVNTATDDITVNVQALPVANAGADVSIEAGQSATLNASGGDSYLWSTGETNASITVKPASSTIYEVKVIKNGCESSDSVKVTVNNTSTGSGIVADAGKDVIICSGSNAVLTASGGSVYTWSNGSSGNTILVSPEKTTIYTVTVSDGVNTATDDVTVEVQDLPVANAGADISIEAGQSTTLTASGGDTYLWSTGETTASIKVKPDSSTNFEVIVTIGGCSSTDTVTVMVNGSAPPATNIVADAGQDIIICKGNSAVLTASGGTYYIWSKGEKTKSIVVSPEITTTYSVTVFDGSSSNTADVTVYVTDLPVASAGNDVTIEAGQSVVLSASGGDQYTWNTGETAKEITVNPLATTTYEVIVGKNGCESTDKVQVTVKEVPPAAANAGSDMTICKGESITLNGDGGTTYSWSTGATSQSITVSPTRTTTYTLTANRGGTTNTDEITVTVINCNLNNGVNNSVASTTGNPATNDTAEQDDAQILNKADFELTVYPNPTEGKINVQTTVPIYNFNLVLMNINGNVIYSDRMDAVEDGINKEIDLSRFTKGVYLLQLYNEEDSFVKKVIVI